MNAVLYVGIFLGAFFLMRNMTPASNLSQAGLDAIKAHEGYSSQPYKDQAGLWTIGYGHLIKTGENYLFVTQEKAEQILQNDVQIAVIAINQLVKTPLTQKQLDALVSFVFNVGVTNFRNSTLLTMLNRGDYTAAKTEFSKWNKITVDGKKIASTGLTKRRASEAAMFT